MSHIDTQQCTYCHREREGRYTRRKGAAAGGWSQGHTQLLWACFDCVPHGQGINEGEAMPTATKASVTKNVTANPQALKAKAEGLALVKPLSLEIVELEDTSPVEWTPEQYGKADELLGRVIEGRKKMAHKFAPILDPLSAALKLAKQAADATKALHKEVDSPLEALETRLRSNMRTFKLEEQRLLREADEERDRLQREQERIQQQMEAARTQLQRNKIIQKQVELEVKAEVMEQSAPQKVYVENSGTRASKRPSISNLADFLRGIADGYIPNDCLEIRQSVLNRHYKDDPEGMEAWPGVTIEDDITIVKR